MTDDQAYAEFARAEMDQLTRVALLLTGQQQAAEDLVQETLVRAYVHWKKVARADSPRAYVRRTMTNAFLRQKERDRARPELLGSVPDAALDGGYGQVDARAEVRQALLALPRRQRTAVVLRHYEHMTEAETARAMGCAVGTVKSLTSRGLASLRNLLDAAPSDRTRT